jgi:hypothetical protein
MPDRFFSNKDWTLLGAELVVVVLGILIAFQVEEWRDSRLAQSELEASLRRLAEETRQNLDRCGLAESRHSLDVADAELVFHSLRSGQLPPEKLVTFERGLAGAVGLPPFRVSVTVADEMISTGMLKQIENEELRLSIASIQDLQVIVDGAYPARRDAIQDLGNELFAYVDMSPMEIDIDGVGDRAIANLDPSVEVATKGSLEEGTAVAYDFASLSSNRRLVNLFYNALDSRVDQLGSIRILCESVQKIDALLQDAVSGKP